MTRERRLIVKETATIMVLGTVWVFTLAFIIVSGILVLIR